MSVGWTNDTPTAAPVAPALAGRGHIATRSPNGVSGKRVFDTTVALVLLLVLLPLLLLIALAVKLDSRGPVIFRQVRLGRGMREFAVLKFRTMARDASSELHREYIAKLVAGDEDGDLKKLTDDPRVTRVGRVLRRLSLDELPQLLNVVAGQMSLVGPRPALAYELDHYEPQHFERFSVRPGLTGLWQVSGRSGLGFREMLDLDTTYARTNSPGTDARILLATPVALVKKPAA